MKPINTTRRKVLTLLGLGAAGSVLASVTGSSRLFAKQFVGEGTKSKMPDMVYDPELQMMVDPITRQPLYEDLRYAQSLPCVTAGCSDCPKRDDPPCKG